MASARAFVSSQGIPSSWRIVRLADVAKTSSGGTPSRGRAEFYGGSIPWVKSGELRDRIIYETEESISEEGLASSSAKLFPKGTVCIALYGATVGRLGILGTDAATNQAVCGIFPGPAVEPRYLYRFLESRRRDLIEQGKGGAQSNISQAIVREISLPLPPVTEQQRIVAEIEKQFTRLDAGVASLKRVQANLRRYRAAVLTAGAEGRSMQYSAEFDGATAHPPEGDLPVLPVEWAWKPLGDFVIERPCNGISVKGSRNPPGIRALRLSAMSERGFDYSDVRYLPLSPSDVDDIWIQRGDFFVSRGNGSLKLVGRGTEAQSPPEPTIFPDTMIRLRLVRDFRESRWLSTIWSSRVIRKQIERRVKTTAGIYKIAQPQLLSIWVPVPPANEQHRIVAEVESRLSVVDESDRVVEANLQRAKNLRQSILQRAFSGNL